MFYGHAINPTVLVDLSTIATQQTNPMLAAMDKVKHFLNYCTSQEDAIIMNVVSGS